MHDGFGHCILNIFAYNVIVGFQQQPCYSNLQSLLLSLSICWPQHCWWLQKHSQWYHHLVIWFYWTWFASILHLHDILPIQYYCVQIASVTFGNHPIYWSTNITNTSWGKISLHWCNKEIHHQQVCQSDQQYASFYMQLSILCVCHKNRNNVVILNQGIQVSEHISHLKPGQESYVDSCCF